MQREPTVSLKQAAALCGVSRRTLYNWMDEDKVQFIRTAGGSRRILERSLYRAGNVNPEALEVSAHA